MQRRQFLKLGGTAVTVALAGCSERLETDSDEAFTEEFDEEYWSDIRESLESGLPATLNAVNLEHPDNYNSFETARIEDQQTRELLEDGYDAEEIFEEIGGIEKLHQEKSDTIDVPIQVQRVLDIDVVNLDGEESRDHINQVVNSVEDSLARNVPENIDIDLQVVDRPVESPAEAIEEISQEYDSKSRNSDLEGSIFQLYLSNNHETNHVSEDAGCYKSGRGPFTGNMAYSLTIESCSPEEHAPHAIHETWHALAKVPHSIVPDKAVSYFSNPSKPTSERMAENNQNIAQAYFNSELEIEETDEGIVCRYQPAEMGETADQGFIENLESALDRTLNARKYDTIDGWRNDWRLQEYDNSGDSSTAVWTHKEYSDAEIRLETRTWYDQEQEQIDFDHQIEYELPEV